MGCKADFAVNSTAIYKKFNARHVTFAARGRAITDREKLCRGSLGLCLGMLIAVVRTGDPSIAMKALVPFGWALFAPLLLILAFANAARHLMS